MAAREICPTSAYGPVLFWSRARDMRILFDHPNPFLLAHGGLQIQIEETKRALENAGVSVDFLRWWDTSQHADIIHFFGRPSPGYVDFAHARDIKVVMSELLTGLGSRPRGSLLAQQWTISLVRRSLPPFLWAKMGWESYEKADAIIALTEWEAHLMRRIFKAPSERLRIVSNGVGDEFLTASDEKIIRGDYLVCTATITPRKGVLELAQAAIETKIPVWIIGKAYGDTDHYAQRFFELARSSAGLIRYEGAIDDRQRLALAYREARGFVLLSRQESLSLSALEAAACGCPLLLTDLPWARVTFGDSAYYCNARNTRKLKLGLLRFYEEAPSLPIPEAPPGWDGIARQLIEIYEGIL